MVRPAPRARLDLHLHTTQSDGRLSPQELLERCAAVGLDYVAITDHDVAPTLKSGWHELGGRRIFLIDAVEISAVYQGRELHLLAYFPGQMPDSFRTFLHSRTRERADRYDTAVERLGLSGLQKADSAARAGKRAITRHHLAHALVQAGHVPNIGAAFRHLIGNHTQVVPLVRLSWEEALERCREAGGLTSWAHPSLDDAEAWTGTFAAMGLHALETRRPRLGRLGRARLERLAQKHRLMVTGGSDWHGLPGTNLGQFFMPGKEARAFMDHVCVAA